MGATKTHVFWWTQMWFSGPNLINFWWISPLKTSCGLVAPEIWCDFMDPGSHAKQWTLFKPSKCSVSYYLMHFGSTIPHEFLIGEKFHFSPPKHMRFLGPSFHIRCQKKAKNGLGPSNHMSANNWGRRRPFGQKVVKNNYNRPLAIIPF